jgi:hypothetical protein
MVRSNLWFEEQLHAQLVALIAAGQSPGLVTRDVAAGNGISSGFDAGWVINDLMRSSA